MSAKRALVVALVVLFALRYDFWLWDDPRRIAGIPVGMAYHIGYCLVAAGLMALLVRFAWPVHVDEADADGIDS